MLNALKNSFLLKLNSAMSLKDPAMKLADHL